MALTVGILTFNSEGTIPDLLESLPHGLAGIANWRLVVADSGSTDGTIEVVRRLAPQTEIISLGANRGFAAAANKVIAVDPLAETVLILSPTTRLHPGCVRALRDCMRDNQAGIAVPRMLRGDGAAVISLRRRPSLLRAWTEAILGGELARRLGPLSETIPNPETYDTSTPAAWATGAVTMLSRECIQKTGEWDESFFLYSEETDYELRAQANGIRLVFTPEAVATHLGGVSTVKPELWALTCANRVRLYGMWHGKLATTVYWAATIFGELLRAAFSRPPTRRAALGKLVREAGTLIRGLPARYPYEGRQGPNARLAGRR